MKQNKKFRIVLITVYLLVWAFALVFFRLMDPSDAGGFSLIFLWVLLPVLSFAESFMIGLKGFWGRWAWLAIPVYGLGLMALEFFTFAAANFQAFGNLNTPELFLFLLGSVVSAAGLALGKEIALVKAKKKA